MSDRLFLELLRKHPRAMRAAGFFFGLAALPIIALGHPWIGLALVLLNRVATFVEHDEALDAIFFAGLPFAFALADPSRALAAVFSLFGLVAVLAVSKRFDRVDEAVCTAAIAIVCVFPAWFSLAAYVLGIAGFAAAGLRFTRTLA